MAHQFRYLFNGEHFCEDFAFLSKHFRKREKKSQFGYKCVIFFWLFFIYFYLKNLLALFSFSFLSPPLPFSSSSLLPSGGSIVHFNELSFSPLPLTVSETANISLTSNLSITSDLPMNAQFSLQLNKTVTLLGNEDPFELPLPCVDGMGSCTAPVCDLFHLWYADYICPFFHQAKQTCACPVKAGIYASKSVPVAVPFDKFKGLWALLSKGQYHAMFTITSPDKKTIFACLKLAARLA